MCTPRRDHDLVMKDAEDKFEPKDVSAAERARSPERAERLAEQLRENLRRRKQQARGRRGADPPGGRGDPEA